MTSRRIEKPIPRWTSKQVLVILVALVSLFSCSAFFAGIQVVNGQTTQKKSLVVAPTSASTQVPVSIPVVVSPTPEQTECFTPSDVTFFTVFASGKENVPNLKNMTGYDCGLTTTWYHVGQGVNYLHSEIPIIPVKGSKYVAVSFTYGVTLQVEVVEASNTFTPHNWELTRGRVVVYFFLEKDLATFCTYHRTSHNGSYWDFNNFNPPDSCHTNH